MFTILTAVIKMVHRRKGTAGKMYLKLRCRFRHIILFVNAISRAKNRPHVLIAYIEHKNTYVCV